LKLAKKKRTPNSADRATLVAEKTSSATRSAEVAGWEILSVSFFTKNRFVPFLRQGTTTVLAQECITRSAFC
jgi:hypothetical protein